MLRARESCICEAIRGGDGFEPLLELLVGEILVSPLRQGLIDLALKPFPKLHGVSVCLSLCVYLWLCLCLCLCVTELRKLLVEEAGREKGAEDLPLKEGRKEESSVCVCLREEEERKTFCISVSVSV